MLRARQTPLLWALLLALAVAVAVLFARKPPPLPPPCACDLGDFQALLARVAYLEARAAQSADVEASTAHTQSVALLEASLDAQGVAAQELARLGAALGKLQAEQAALAEQAQATEAGLGAVRTQTLAAARTAVEAWLDAAEARRSEAGEASCSAAPPLDAVLRALDTWQADRTGLPDYALASAGGRMVAHSPLHHSQAGQLRSRAVHPRANDLLLTAAIESPGHCLALDGAAGWVEVELRTRLQLSAMTLEHVHPALTYDIGTAPAGFALLAADEGRNETLAEGAFALTGSPVQTFPALSGGLPVRRVRLVLRGNQGASYTCLYRLRVHGSPAEG